jgi:hypothetical protein
MISFSAQMLQGTLCEVRFEWPKHEPGSVIKEEDLAEMRETSRTDLCVNQICYINGEKNDIFHREYKLTEIFN